MFATIRRYRLLGGSMDSLLHEVDVGFAEMIQEQDGFVAYEVAQPQRAGARELVSLRQ